MGSKPTGFTEQPISSKFIHKIREEIRLGYSVCPFVGSGVSAASGILMGQEFNDYLAHTVKKVLADCWDIRTQGWPEKPTRKAHEENKEYLRDQFVSVCQGIGLKPRWNDQKELYGFEDIESKLLVGESHAGTTRPIVPAVLRPSSAIQRADYQRITSCQLTDTLASLLEPTSHPNLSTTSKQYVVEAGIRHLFDWRATLKFLATAEIQVQNGERRPMMGEFASSVIDSFNRHITTGKKPNLGHKMLAHLSRPLRCRLFLTTNFDDLLEQALRTLDMSVVSLDVRVNGTLPPPSTVRAQNTILKLHGSLIETRADFTLDLPPSREDLERLRKIVIGSRYGMSAEATADTTDRRKHILSHLLVLGYSGSDRRCVLMIKHLLDSDRRLKVFWVCQSQWDMEKLGTLFHEAEYRDRVIAHQSARPDLLLYEMYQELTFSLPSGGFAYEFTHKVPPRPLMDPDDPHRYIATQRQEEVASEISGYITKGRRPRSAQLNTNTANRIPRGGVFPAPDHEYQVTMHDPCCYDILRLTAEDPGTWPAKGQLGQPWFQGTETSVYVFEIDSGAVNTSRLVFDKVSRQGRRCLWMEMQDYVHPRHLFDELFRTLSLWRGVHQIENLRYTHDFPETWDGKCSADSRLDRAAPVVSQVERDRLDLERAKRPERAREICSRQLPHYENLLEYLQFADRNADNKLQTNIVLFLYGRSVPGACSGQADHAWTHTRETALDHGTVLTHYDQFHLMLEVLSRCGITVVYMPLTLLRVKSEEAKEYRVDGLKRELKGQLEPLGVLKHPRDAAESSPVHQVLYEHFRNLTDLHTLTSLASDTVKMAVDYQYGAYADAPTSLDDLQVPDSSAFYTTINSLLNDFFSTRTPRGTRELSSQGPVSDASERSRLYADLIEDTPDARFRFLYAVTLFRQSRHVSAFISEAVFRSPHRFYVGNELPWARSTSRKAAREPSEYYEAVSTIPLGELQADNDLCRKTVTDLWVRIVQKHEVFLYKAGAYCWKFRDVRHALREILELGSEQLHYSEFARFQRHEHSQNVFVGQLRPRCHLWIASWYVSAYLATGHTNPLLEAMYHYRQAITFGLVAAPSSVNELSVQSQRDYAEAIVTTASFDVRKLLRICSQSLPEFGWGPNMASTAKEGRDGMPSAELVECTKAVERLLEGLEATDVGTRLKVHLDKMCQEIDDALAYRNRAAQVGNPQLQVTGALARRQATKKINRISDVRMLERSASLGDVLTGTRSAAIKAVRWSELKDGELDDDTSGHTDVRPEGQLSGLLWDLTEQILVAPLHSQHFEPSGALTSEINQHFNRLQPHLTKTCLEFCNSQFGPESTCPDAKCPVTMLAVALAELGYAFLKRAKLEIHVNDASLDSAREDRMSLVGTDSVREWQSTRAHALPEILETVVSMVLDEMEILPAGLTVTAAPLADEEHAIDAVSKLVAKAREFCDSGARKIGTLAKLLSELRRETRRFEPADLWEQFRHRQMSRAELQFWSGCLVGQPNTRLGRLLHAKTESLLNSEEELTQRQIKQLLTAVFSPVIGKYRDQVKIEAAIDRAFEAAIQREVLDYALGRDQRGKPVGDAPQWLLAWVIEILAPQTQVDYWENPSPRLNLICASVCCNLADRVCQMIPPESFSVEIDVRVKVRGIYGTTMGYLSRYFEAHRHFNEGMALLSKSSMGLQGLPLAIIRLRRAEVYLALAKRSKRRMLKALRQLERMELRATSPESLDEPKRSDRGKSLETLLRDARFFFATLDDAVIHLEHAEGTLAAVASSGKWWARQITLSLRAYSVLPSRPILDRLEKYGVETDPLLFRRRRQHDADVAVYFRRLINITSHDLFRRIRAIDFFARALLTRHGDGSFTIQSGDPAIERAVLLIDKLWADIFRLNGDTTDSNAEPDENSAGEEDSSLGDAELRVGPHFVRWVPDMKEEGLSSGLLFQHRLEGAAEWSDTSNPRKIPDVVEATGSMLAKFTWRTAVRLALLLRILMDTTSD